MLDFVYLRFNILTVLRGLLGKSFPDTAETTSPTPFLIPRGCQCYQQLVYLPEILHAHESS